MPTPEQELKAATDAVLDSKSEKKLVVAGPGAGKTFLFKSLLKKEKGDKSKRLVLTFINTLKDDLERNLGEYADVHTLHAYCQSLLYKKPELRKGLGDNFICHPLLASLIRTDWSWLQGTVPPHFVKKMRTLELSDDEYAFYSARGTYYDAVDFDDSVYRIHRGLIENPKSAAGYDLVLVDEFQDFNTMEASVIAALANQNRIVIAGDDDQALYSKWRAADWKHIRAHHSADEYETFYLPFCMRCPQVVVTAASEIISNAKGMGALQGRIDKPYRYYAPEKGADSKAFPHINVIKASVQNSKAKTNYFGKYIAKAIAAIPEAHAAEAAKRNEPLVLIIGSPPYLPQVRDFLVEQGIIAKDEKEAEEPDRVKGLRLLKLNERSNLGWRLILQSGDPRAGKNRVRQAHDESRDLFDVTPEEERAAILKEAQALADPDKPEKKPAEMEKIKLVSYESSKGLSAQYVFLIGLHAGDLPRNIAQIEDIEICKLLVGLTRTKKQCNVMIAGMFAGQFKQQSIFLSWIPARCLNRFEVNKQYWT